MKTVLLVDDDEDQLALRRLLLEHHGFSAACACAPDAALDLARDTQLQAAVVDIGLPTESQGWDLISKLKRTAPSVPIIVLSGSPEPRSIGAMHGIQAWITKGSGVRALIDVLQRTTA